MAEELNSTCGKFSRTLAIADVRLSAPLIKAESAARSERSLLSSSSAPHGGREPSFSSVGFQRTDCQKAFARSDAESASSGGVAGSCTVLAASSSRWMARSMHRDASV